MMVKVVAVIGGLAIVGYTLHRWSKSPSTKKGDPKYSIPTTQVSDSEIGRMHAANPISDPVKDAEDLAYGYYAGNPAPNKPDQVYASQTNNATATTAESQVSDELFDPLSVLTGFDPNSEKTGFDVFNADPTTDMQGILRSFDNDNPDATTPGGMDYTPANAQTGADPESLQGFKGGV